MSSKASIDKKTLEHLADLSRIELNKESESKLLEDLQKILEHFEELKEVGTENIEPMSGGMPVLSEAEGIEVNVFREDESNVKCQMSNVGLIDQFPEKENGFLRVPAVFE